MIGLQHSSGPSLFDGPHIRRADDAALGAQLAAVRAVMSDRQWHTLAELAAAAQCSDASASARLRDLRKGRFGGHVVECQRYGKGMPCKYRLGGA
jgi:hypothetical protein